MNLALFQSLWATPGSESALHEPRFNRALQLAQSAGFEGIEGPLPPHAADRKAWRAQLADRGLLFIQEICTATPRGSYLPHPAATVDDHVASFLEQAVHQDECPALFISTLAGCDAWSLNQTVDCYGRILDLAADLGRPVSFETHRGRPTFSPWSTRAILHQLPHLTLTCDFSHWCVVAERLVLDTEPDLLKLCAARARHIHGRIGYDQGPQVPHPGAPEFVGALDAHLRWWSALWEAQQLRTFERSTFTPEFGPDGYLHELPFSRQPVADLTTLNRWIAQRARLAFQSLPSLSPSSH